MSSTCTTELQIGNSLFISCDLFAISKVSVKVTDREEKHNLSYGIHGGLSARDQNKGTVDINVFGLL